uniref:Uncharacterized protein n=1 Tax=Solanum tuberosum TaxID=4113 RepID=M1DQU1_SOLTU
MTENIIIDTVVGESGASNSNAIGQSQTVESQVNKARKKRSRVWDHFFRKIDSDGIEKGVCNYRKKEYFADTKEHGFTGVAAVLNEEEEEDKDKVKGSSHLIDKRRIMVGPTAQAGEVWVGVLGPYATGSTYVPSPMRRGGAYGAAREVSHKPQVEVAEDQVSLKFGDLLFQETLLKMLGMLEYFSQGGEIGPPHGSQTRLEAQIPDSLRTQHTYSSLLAKDSATLFRGRERGQSSRGDMTFDRGSISPQGRGWGTTQTVGVKRDNVMFF